MIMENEKPTYEQVVQAYTNVYNQLEEAKREIQVMQSDRLTERLNVMLHIVENKDKYPKDVVKLAIWHVKKIMAKPKVRA